MKDMIEENELKISSSETSLQLPVNGNGESYRTSIFNSSSNNVFHGSGSISPSPFKVEDKKMTTEDDITKFMGTFEMMEIEDHSDLPSDQRISPIPPPPTPVVETVTSTTSSTANSYFKNIFSKDLFNNINIFAKDDKTHHITSTTTTTTTTTTSKQEPEETQKQSQQKSSSTSATSGTNIISNLYYKFKYSIISPETEEALSNINVLFDKLFGDIPYSKFQVFLGLLLLDNYYSNSHFNSQAYVVDKEFIKTASYYMRFASATFGWKYINGYLYSSSAKGLFKGVTGGDSLNNDLVAEYTGIAREDIILAKWTSSNFDPGHYIAYDHKNKAIVLAIRGTFHARDILTDLVAKEIKFYDGYAHAGILRCAENKFAELAPVLLEHYNRMDKDGKNYGIIVCGHSLGGGVASLFTIMFKTNYPGIPIHCYAYAPPSIGSMEISLSVEYRSLIDTFVFNDDIVPRLCYASLEHLLELVLCILKKNDSITQLGFQILAAGNTFGDQVTDRIGSLLKLKKDTMLKYQELHLSNKTMLPPGRMFRIYKNSPNEPHYVMEESNPSFFKEIIISNTLLTDHMPDKYELGFQSCIDNLESVIPNFLQDKDKPVGVVESPNTPKPPVEKVEVPNSNSMNENNNQEVVLTEVVQTITKNPDPSNSDKVITTNVEVVKEIVLTHDHNGKQEKENSEEPTKTIQIQNKGVLVKSHL
ncbi:hypothetical protein DLAC_07808 [Tieghemostelium lacteum]|uniref:sn-1-specific diacylglycerol lipase n=1 Tax=Tieghemostelium lacteum TaxID=361077 RepID=A0A151ZAF9_TIELA|nr:hypothetical protein DLAC_07808 [Tieghemostelium lacteum]|eukprot:KYQ90932.1 hypothetical protein DLAC_07808 [Tieghemostelium lacteum]